MALRRSNRPWWAAITTHVMVVCMGAALASRVARGEESTDTSFAGMANTTPAIEFARDIQPILANKCIRCHGPETREAGLRLDDRKAAASKLESGNYAIVPGQPDDSELLRRVTADESEWMPPEEPPLDAIQVATLRKWIDAGAKWPDHWAYQPLEATTPPDFDDAKLEGWCRTPIDRFILSELCRKDFRPAPEADRRTLLRRLYFDLIGLPPSPEEVDAYLADKSSNAYERMRPAVG